MNIISMRHYALDSSVCRDLSVVGGELLKERRITETKLARDLQVSAAQPRATLKYKAICRDLYDVFACTTASSTLKAQSVLGYKSHTLFREAMSKAQWCIDCAGLAQPVQDTKQTPQSHR